MSFLSDHEFIIRINGSPEVRGRLFGWIDKEFGAKIGNKDKGWTYYCVMLDEIKENASAEAVAAFQKRFVDLLHPDVKKEIGRQLLQAYTETIEKEVEVAHAINKRRDLGQVRPQKDRPAVAKPWWKKLW